jgi:hypothetical protein
MTLSREFMGMAALAILWLNTLLVVAATLRPLLASLGRARRFRRQGIIAKTVDTIAEHRIEQVARRVQAAGRQALLWHDRNYGSVVLSGEIERGDERFELVPCEGVEAEVWVSPARIKANAACPSLQSFDDAYKQAKGAKGYRRILRTAVDAGQRVWVCGNIKDGKLYGSETAPLWVSTQCPLAWRRRHLLLWLLFSLITVAVASAISFLVLQPPWFGRLSTLGGALGLVYFLLVQPAGVAFRDATLPPNRAAVGGRWLAPKP